MPCADEYAPVAIHSIAIKEETVWVLELMSIAFLRVLCIWVNWLSHPLHLFAASQMSLVTVGLLRHHYRHFMLDVVHNNDLMYYNGMLK